MTAAAVEPMVLVRFFAKPGAEARVESILRTMVRATRQEPGCRRYDLFRVPAAESDAVFALVERYADEAAVLAHRETPHYKAYRANIVELLAQPIEVIRLEPLDARGG